MKLLYFLFFKFLGPNIVYEIENFVLLSLTMRATKFLLTPKITTLHICIYIHKERVIVVLSIDMQKTKKESLRYCQRLVGLQLPVLALQDYKESSEVDPSAVTDGYSKMSLCELGLQSL